MGEVVPLQRKGKGVSFPHIGQRTYAICVDNCRIGRIRYEQGWWRITIEGCTSYTECDRLADAFESVRMTFDEPTWSALTAEQERWLP